MTRTFAPGRRRRVQRPSQMTDTASEEFFTAVAAIGPHPYVAAEMVGLNPRVVARWIDRGEGKEHWVDRHDGKGRVLLPRTRVYVEFAEKYRGAVARWQAHVLANMTARTQHDGPLALQLMERFGPETFQRATPTATPTVGDQTNFLFMDPELAARITHQMLAEARAARAITEPELVPIVVERPPDNGHSRALASGLREDG